MHHGYKIKYFKMFLSVIRDSKNTKELLPLVSHSYRNEDFYNWSSLFKNNLKILVVHFTQASLLSPLPTENKPYANFTKIHLQGPAEPPVLSCKRKGVVQVKMLNHLKCGSSHIALD